MSLIPTTHANKLSVIRDAFKGKGPFAEQIRALFPPTDHVVDSVGDLVWVKGEYDPEKHRAAHNRAKMWMPVIGNTLEWKQHPKMKPFRRRFNVEPNFRQIKTQKKYVQRKCVNTWQRGLPPAQIGMVGTYKGEKAVIVGERVKAFTMKRRIGIGDPGNVFMQAQPVRHLGTYKSKVHKEVWIIRTRKGISESVKTSNVFKRQNLVIPDLTCDKTVLKYI